MSLRDALQDHSDNLRLYFLAAVFAWLLKEDEAARLAALSAVTTAVGWERTLMLTRVAEFAAAERTPPATTAKLRSFMAEVESKNWGMWSIAKLRRALLKADREYYSSISPPDATVFWRRYPDLLGAADQLLAPS